MSPTTKRLLLGSLVLAGALTFAVLPASSSGPFDGSGQSGRGSTTATSVQSALLGELLSVDQITLTRATPGEDSIRTREMTYFRMAPSSVNANARFRFNPDTGFEFSSALLNCAGCSAWTDSLVSRQGDRSVRVDQAQGLGLTPQGSLGTCDNTTGSGHAREGDMKTLAATLTSRTRTCTCTLDTAGGSGAWALDGGAGLVGTSTTCPEVAP